MKWTSRFLLLFALAATLSASTVLSVDFNRLSLIATQVVGGEVVRMESFRDADNGYIYTNVTMRLQQALPARVGAAEYTFRMIGGDHEGTRVYIADMPRFEVGDDVILFLNRQPQSVLGPTVGLWQGVFYVETDKQTGVERVVDHQRRPVLEVRGGKLVRGARLETASSGVALGEEASPTGLSPNGFFQQVKSLRSGSAANR